MIFSKNISLQSYGFLLGSMLLMVACSSIIELDTPNAEGRISIYGQLTNSPLHFQPVQVMITSTDIRRPVMPFAEANVSIIEEQGATHEYQYNQEKERYIPIEPFHGVPGRTYQLIVVANDQHYVSSPQTIPVTNGQDSSFLRFDSETFITNAGASVLQYKAKVFTHTILPETEKLYLKWEVEQVHVQTELSLPKHVFPFSSPRNCYIIEPALSDNILLFDGAENDALEIPEMELFEMQLDQTLDTAGGFGIYQYSITQEALEYWKKIDLVSNRVGSIFEVPPAAVQGNLSNPEDPSEEVLGFFEVSKVDTTGVFIVAEDLPIFIGLAGPMISCDYPQNYLDGVPFQCTPCLTTHLGVPEACYDCLTLSNSTLKRPAYLPE